MNEFLLESETTLDDRGNILVTREYVYDENGNLISEGTPFDGLSGSSITYTYDEDGNLVTEASQFIGSLSIFFTINYTYDEDGNLATRASQSGTGSSDGIPDAITTYTYDENNNLILESTDNVDGILDTTTTYTYDENSNLILESTDDEVDGSVDRTVTYTYDESNNLVEEIYEYNIDDNIINETIAYQYDENNTLVSAIEAKDFDFNGEIDIVTTYTYDDGNLVEETNDFDGDDIPDTATTYIYDENNNLITEVYDDDADGVGYERISYSYIQDPLQSRLSLTDVHRFYQYERGFHFYTSNSEEIASVREQSDAGTLSYEYEAPQYQVLADNIDTLTGEEISGVSPIYRFFNNDTGAHLYTMSEEEKDSIQANLDNYSFEGIRYYAFESEPEDFETIGVYRFLNTDTGTHLFSSDRNELDNIEANLPNFVMENDGEAAFYVFEL